MVPILCILSACTDAAPFAPADQAPQFDHNYTGYFSGCSYNEPPSGSCSDRTPTEWEWNRYYYYSGTLCTAASSVIDTFWYDSNIRIRTDSGAPGGDWHWGDGVHFASYLLDRDDWTIRWTMAHEAGHHICDCDDEDTASQFADDCIGPL